MVIIVEHRDKITARGTSTLTIYSVPFSAKRIFFCKSVFKTVKLHITARLRETNDHAAIIQLVCCSLEAKLVFD